MDFPELGINVSVLEPGVQMAMYHWEADRRTSSYFPGRRCSSSKARNARYDSGTSSIARSRRSTRSWGPEKGRA